MKIKFLDEKSVFENIALESVGSIILLNSWGTIDVLYSIKIK